MLILGVETSGVVGSIALRMDDATLAERHLDESGRRHARTLVSEVRQMLSSQELTVNDIDAVAVSIGPGSFTGLRVGVVFAKTFAWSTGCSAIAIDTLAAIAANSPDSVKRLHVVMDAQRGELFAREFVSHDSGWSPSGETRIIPAEVFCGGLGDDDVISGPACDKLESEFQLSCKVLDHGCRNPTAAVVAGLAAHRLVAAETDEILTLEPRYLRKSAAEEKADGAGVA